MEQAIPKRRAFWCLPCGAFDFSAPSVADMGADNRVYKKKWERNRSHFVTRKGFYVFCVTRKGCCYKLNAYNEYIIISIKLCQALFSAPSAVHEGAVSTLTLENIPRS